MRTQRFRFWVLPVLLAALVFRVLAPPGFLMSGGDMALSASMCATTPGKIEKIELPGEPVKIHCEFCLAPPLGAPFFVARIDASAPAASPPVARVTTQLPDFPLVRAHSARAPPLA